MWKKVGLIVMVLVLGFLAEGEALQEQEKGKNLLKNPSFEDKFDGWSTRKLKSEVFEIEEKGYKGRCVSIKQTNEEEYGTIFQRVKAKENRYYKWSVRIKGEDIKDTTGLFFIECYDASNKHLGDLCEVKRYGTFDWTEFKGAGKTPEGTVYIEVRCGNRYGKGKVWFDEVELEEMPEEEEKEEKKEELTVPKKEIEELSPFEEYVHGKYTPFISTRVFQFGYEFFEKVPSSFAPVENIPVGPDYIIGPGDEIKISLWGMIEGEYSFIVDRNGQISIPKVGVLNVAGLSYKELKEFLKKEFLKYYKGFEMNVSLGNLRTIQVYVVGNAKKPGLYTISSLSTLVNALFLCGGPSKIGTMRDIQLKRDGKTIVHFDLYDFLLKGDKSKDVKLMTEDIIYIPPCGQLIAIVGNVKRPAIYEVKDKIKIRELIDLAGGITPTGYLQRVQVERIFKNEVKIILDIDLSEIEKNDIELKDGDIVKIFHILNLIANAVTLEGNVSRPGQYQWFEGMKISDLIKEPEKDLLPETEFKIAFIERFVPPDYHKELISFNLEEAILKKNPEENKLLQPYDVVKIYNKWELKTKDYVTISGAVNKPGRYELRENMKISDLIKLAGGVKYYSYTEKAELTRIIPEKDRAKTIRIDINIEKALNGDESNDLILKPEDYLIVKALPDWEEYRKVKIEGEVKFPGEYTIKKGEKLSSIIERAGGFTEDAFLKGTIFIREEIKKRQMENLERFKKMQYDLLLKATLSSDKPEAIEQLIKQQETISQLISLFPLGRIFLKISELEKLKDTPYDIYLEDGDTIYIPKKPGTVMVMGAVNSPGTIIYTPGKDLEWYIEKCGGYNNYSDRKNLVIIHPDGSCETKFVRIKEIEEGDIIIVPERAVYSKWNLTKDIVDIFYKIALPIAVYKK